MSVFLGRRTLEARHGNTRSGEKFEALPDCGHVLCEVLVARKIVAFRRIRRHIEQAEGVARRALAALVVDPFPVDLKFKN